MKRKFLIFICLCFLASCASAPQQWSGRDRFGIMKIDIPGDYHDYTQTYLQDIEKVRVSRGRPQNPSIKSLLMIKHSDDRTHCKFRELRYLRNEVGYTWGVDRLATEVALFFNKLLTTSGTMDYYNLGLAAPIPWMAVTASTRRSLAGAMRTIALPAARRGCGSRIPSPGATARTS